MNTAILGSSLYTYNTSFTIISFQGDCPHDVKFTAPNVLRRDVDVDLGLLPEGLPHNLEKQH